MTKDELLDLIDSKVYENKSRKITGTALNETLKAMVNNAGESGGIITLDGSKWALASKEGSGPYTKEEAMELLGWTEDEFDAFLPEATDELPKPCAVFYNGYLFPQYVISTDIWAYLFVPRYADVRSETTSFDVMKIYAYESSPNVAKGPESDDNSAVLYIIYGFTEIQDIL